MTAGGRNRAARSECSPRQHVLYFLNSRKDMPTIMRRAPEAPHDRNSPAAPSSRNRTARPTSLATGAVVTLLLAVQIALVACGDRAPNEQDVDETPANTPAPTHTPTPANTHTPIPTNTPAPTHTPTPANTHTPISTVSLHPPRASSLRLCDCAYRTVFVHRS